MNIKTICLAVTSFVCVALFAAFETPQQAINASRKAIQSKNYAEAHKNLTEGYKLAVNPTERILVLNQHANLYAMQRDWKNAEKMIMMIINDKAAVPAQKASAWLTIARFKENQRKYEEAVEAYQASLELHKEGNQVQEALNKCGLALIRIKDYTAAIECFKQVPSIPNKDARRSMTLKMASFQNIATAYIAMKQYQNAIKTLDDAAKLPDFKDAKSQKAIQNTIVRIYDSQISEAIRFKRFDDAEASLNLLKKNYPASNIIAKKEIAILTGRAALAARKRDYAAAESYYKKALTVKGAEANQLRSVYNDMANFYFRFNKKSEAEKAMQAMIALPCKTAEEQYQTNFLRSRFLSLNKNFDEAIKIMEETAKLKGLTPARVASCYGNICSLYFNKNDYERAREYYKKAKSVPNGNWKYEYLRKKLGFQN